MDDRPGQIKAHNAIARAAGRIGDDDAALDHLTRTLGLYEEGQQHAAAFTHLTFCEVLERQGRYADALDHVRLALDMPRAAGDGGGQARSCNGIGWYHARLGDYRQALVWCEKALAMYRELGEVHGQAHVWDSLGYAHHHLGDHEQAIACYQRAVDLYREVGDRYNEADTLDSLGGAHTGASDADAASDAWKLAQVILEDLDSPDAERVRAKLAGRRA